MYIRNLPTRPCNKPRRPKAKTSSWPYTSLPSLGRKLRWQVTGFLGRVGIFRGPVAPIDVGQDHIKRWAAPGVKPDQRVDQFLRMRTDASTTQRALKPHSLAHHATACRNQRYDHDATRDKLQIERRGIQPHYPQP